MIKSFLIALFILSSSAFIVRQTDSNQKWTKAISESELIVVGVVAKNSVSVVRPQEIKSNQDFGQSNIVNLPSPDKYKVGQLYRIQVEEFLKKPKESDDTKTIDVFIPGDFPRHGDSFLIEGEKIVLFLRRIDEEKNSFAGTSVLRINPDYSSRLETFVTARAYSVIPGDQGVINDDSNIEKIIKEVKRYIK